MLPEVLVSERVVGYYGNGTPTTFLKWRMRQDPKQQSVIVFLSVREDKVDGGGTGFLVGMSTVDPAKSFTYVVTAKHVIQDGGLNVSFNTKRGGRRFVKTEEKDWLLHPDSDVALIPLDPDHGVDDALLWSADMFVTPEIIDEHYFGIGDPVYMMGRFVFFQGREVNRPVLRHGNVSLMNEEPIQHPRYKEDHEVFLVEMRSRGGLTGSPVFIYKPPVSPVYGANVGDPMTFSPRMFDRFLLGVDWGHYPVQNKVFYPSGQEAGYMESTSAMCCVAPAWKVMDLINDPHLIAMREEENESLSKQMKPGQGRIELTDSDFSPARQGTLRKKLEEGDEGAGDFDSAMRRVVPPEPDDESS